MKKLRIKDVVTFRRKTEGPRKTFIFNLKTAGDKKDNGDGRNYWVRSETAIKNTFRSDNPRFISDKIEEVQELLTDTGKQSNTRKQYLHNISILKGFGNFDFNYSNHRKILVFCLSLKITKF